MARGGRGGFGSDGSGSESDLSPARAACQDFLEAEDLGLSPDSDACREVVEDLGSAPPWPLSAIRGHFDRRYPGWDSAPALTMSSPVRRLRSLCDVVDGRDGDEAVEEALQVLSNEVRHAQIKIMCPRDGSGGFTDECQFLLLALEQTGLALLRERGERRRDNRRAATRLEDLEAARRGAQEDAALLAREETKHQLEELAAEAEAQRASADVMRAEVDELRAKDDQGSELLRRLEAADRELMKLARERDEAVEDLRESRTRCSRLAAENEGHEGALDLLNRQLSQSQSPVVAAAAVERARAAATPGRGRVRALAFAAGARSAAILAAAADHGGALRTALVAWRLVRLQACWARAGEAASADSLEAELTLTGDRPPMELPEAFVGTCGYCGRYNEPADGGGDEPDGCGKLWLHAVSGPFARRPRPRPTPGGARGGGGKRAGGSARVAARPRWSPVRLAVRLMLLFILSFGAALAAEPYLSGGW